MKNFKEHVKEKITSGNAFREVQNKRLFIKMFSTSIEDFNWLKEKVDIADNFKFVRKTASQLDKLFEGSLEYALILLNGKIMSVDDIDKEFKNENNDSLEKENTLYTFYDPIFDTIIENVEHNQHFNIITVKESSLCIE